MKKVIKSLLQIFGYKIERFDPLEASIPAQYNHSLFLPRLYQGSLERLFYFKDVFELTREVDGDIVECGVSIGHGALLFTLLSNYIAKPRVYYGFDSFEGFPSPVKEDEETPITGKGYWANTPATVMRVLKDGRLTEETINNRIRLIKGWFNETLIKYDGKIAILHLDCDLYESYKISLNSLYGKVQPGGVIMFDEYNDDRWPGATKAINEFFQDKTETITPHHKCTWKYFVVKN